MLKARIILVLTMAFGVSFITHSAHAQSDNIRLRQVLISLNSPVYLTNAGDGSNRLFVVEQRGKIKVAQPGATSTTDFLDVSTLVSSTGGERGLLGLAFHPQYATNRRFFIFYTRELDGAVEIAEYQTSAANPNLANPTPIRVILTIAHQVANHNGGTILFGPDGFLYAGIGDGTGGNDAENNAQNLDRLLGKIIRIDIDTPVFQDPAYDIPPTNPYEGDTQGRDEIYASGFRNPYRFSFDRGGSHQLWVGDVGQEAIEEVNTVTLGGNYGWRVYEGTQCTGLDPSLCVPANYLPPVFEYASIGDTPRCSVTGGHVYRGTLGTFTPGSYVYSDFCTGEILTWENGAQTVRLDTTALTTAIGEDESGELYVVSLGGTVHKLVRRRASADFDGDLRTDVSIFRPSNGTWYVLNSASANTRIQAFGTNNDIPVAEDFDGDFISDIGVYRPSTGVWYYYRSSDGVVGIANFGTSGDVPAAADYDGDQKSDLAVFRPSTGTWYIFSSVTNSALQALFGMAGDVPVAGDYDGDGKYDIAIWRPGNGLWYWINSSNNSISNRQFGQPGDIPTIGDFDGDERTDIGVFRASQEAWYTTNSQDGSVFFTHWGGGDDVPAVGDYDGDGRDDIAVFRPSDGIWYRISSSNQAFVYTHFGMSGDLAIPRFAGP